MAATSWPSSFACAAIFFATAVSLAMARTSIGFGRYAHMPSRSACTPLFLIAVPRNTGEKRHATVARRSAATSSSMVGSRSSMKISAISSSTSDSCSMSSCRFSLASSSTSAGMSSDSRTTLPLVPSLYTAFQRTRSTRPWKLSSAPIGTCIAAAGIRSFVRICSTTRHGFAPARSILLMNERRGTE